MKLPPTKNEIRERLNSQVQDFLQEGGEVTEVPRGISGRENPKSALPDNSFAPSPRSQVPAEDLLPLNDVVKDIEARRKTRGKPAPSKKTRPAQPKKKIIYDDFGEPLRYTWVDE